MSTQVKSITEWERTLSSPGWTPERLRQCEKRAAIESERLRSPLLHWAKTYHRTEKNEPIDFVNWKHLVGPYSDNAQHIVIMKDTQTGWSSREIAEVFMRCAQGWSILYVLPTQKIRGTFVSNRIDKTASYVPYYQHLIDNATGTSDQVSMKHIGPGVAKFVGSNAVAEFIEFPADMVIIDERNRCDEENLPYAFDRLDASDHKFTRILGNPTVKGKGIDPLFEASDQRNWTIPCPHCGEWQALDWFKHVIRETGDRQYELRDAAWSSESSDDIRVYCTGCGKPLDRLADGQWVPSYPGRPVHGYHFNKLAFHKCTVAELYDLWLKAQGNETLLQAFYNSKLGLPYMSSSIGLTRALLDRCIGDYVMPSQSAGPCVGGADVGSVINVVISERREGKLRAVYIGTVNSFEELDELTGQFNVGIWVVDARPETRAARQFADRHPGVVFLCQYVATDKVSSKYSDMSEFWHELKHPERIVNTDRTQSMDASHARIINQDIELPQAAGSIKDFYEQMIFPVRLFDEKRGLNYWTGGLGHTEEKGPDHYRHAWNYLNIADRIARTAGSMLS